MGKRSREEINGAYMRRLAEIRKTHKIKVLDLRIVEALTGGEGRVDFSQFPKYKCTCGASFETEGEADAHLEEVKSRSSAG